MTATVARLSFSSAPASTIPVPIGFESTSTSPGRAPALAQRRGEVGGREGGEVVGEGGHGGVVERRQPDEEPGRIGGRAGRWPASDGTQQPGQRSGAPLRRASAARRPLRELHIHETQY